MSLIKLAGILTGGVIGKTLYNMRISAKGGFKKYLSGKSKNWYSPRKKMQEAIISTGSQSIHQIRSGNPLNTQNLRGSFTDAASGNALQENLREYEKYRNSKLYGKATKYLTNKVIKQDGTIDVNNLEKIMKKTKMVYDTSNAITTKGKYLPIGGLVAGGGIGALRKPDENGSRKKNILKGMFVGGTLGSGIKSGARSIKKAFDNKGVSKGLNEYFADDYWKTRITKANSNPMKYFGKTVAKNITYNNKDAYKVLAQRIKDNEYQGMP